MGPVKEPQFFFFILHFCLEILVLNVAIFPKMLTFILYNFPAKNKTLQNISTPSCGIAPLRGREQPRFPHAHS